METKISRAAVIAALPPRYDASTVRIHADGRVSARIDCNLQPGAQNIPRLYVGTADQLVRDAQTQAALIDRDG